MRAVYTGWSVRILSCFALYYGIRICHAFRRVEIVHDYGVPQAQVIGPLLFPTLPRFPLTIQGDITRYYDRNRLQMSREKLYHCLGSQLGRVKDCFVTTKVDVF